MPTLDELRAQSGPAPLPRTSRTVTLVEGQHLLDAAQRLTTEQADLMAAARGVDEDGERNAPPPKAGQGAKESRARTKRLGEIPDELSAIVASLGEFQEIVELEGIKGGEWQRFKDDNPPREDNVADAHFAFGHCNSSSVFEDLGRYVKTWAGEPIAKGDWNSWLAERICYADRRDLVSDVVKMHEQGMSRAPKLLNASSTTGSSETA